MSIQTLLVFACLLVFAVDTCEASERDQFRMHIAEARWKEASSYTYKYRWEAGKIVAERWLEMKTAGESSQARFALLEFFWRQRLGSPRTRHDAASMRKDYLQLGNEMELSGTDLAFTAATDQYFDRFADEKVRSFSELQRRHSLEELVEALKARPEDIAVLMSLDTVARSSYSYGDELDLSTMGEACTSPASKIVLAELVADWGTRLRMEFRRPIIESALPHLPDDENREAMLWKLLSPGYTISDAARADELMARYPRTLEARIAFERKLSAVAARNVADAQQLLGDSVDTLGLTPEQLKLMTLTIVDAVGTGDPSFSKARPTDVAAAKQILRSLSAELDPRLKGIVVDRAILFAKRIGDERLLTGLANYRMKHAPANDMHEVTSVIGRHFMKLGEWEKAQHAWESWPASSGWCGSWTIFPSESRKVRIATCLLHQRKREEAVRVLADALTDPRVDSQIILPFLLFQIYDRAGQLDDFEKILSNLESDERLMALRSRRMGGYDEQRIELLQLAKHHWTVRGMFVVRSLADEQNWDQLVKICQSYPSDYRSSTSSDDRLEFPLEHSIAIEAARLLSESDVISTPSIRQTNQLNATVLWPAPPESSLPKTLPLNWPQHDEPPE